MFTGPTSTLLSYMAMALKGDLLSALLKIDYLPIFAGTQEENSLKNFRSCVCDHTESVNQCQALKVFHQFTPGFLG